MAMGAGTDLFALDDIRARTNLEVRPVVAAPADIEAAIRRYGRDGESVEAVVSEAASSAEEDIREIESLATAVDEGPVVRMVDTLIAQAIADRASDIHIEPGERDVCIRFRVDGVLHDVTTSPRNVLERLVARLKVMAEMDIAERRRPQDGRVGLTVSGRPYDLRVATLPHGQRRAGGYAGAGQGLGPPRPGRPGFRTGRLPGVRGLLHQALRRHPGDGADGLLHVTHNGVLVATHARRHLADDDDRMDRGTKAARAARPTSGGEVLRKVDPSGSVSFAGTTYRAGNRSIGQVVGVRVVGDTVQITRTGSFCAPTEPGMTSSRSSGR